jgi:hypothetical protein
MGFDAVDTTFFQTEEKVRVDAEHQARLIALTRLCKPELNRAEVQ